jgi:P27 family predicted phage terminase small subunit
MVEGLFRQPTNLATKSFNQHTTIKGRGGADTSSRFRAYDIPRPVNFLRSQLKNIKKEIHDMPNHRKSNEQKRLAGTYRKDRDVKPTAGERLTEAPEAPDAMSQGARQEWKALAPVLVELGILTRGDLRAAEQLCETLATANALQAIIAAEGVLLKMGNGAYKTNPAQRSLEVARNQAMRMYDAFGITPKARGYVSAAPEHKNDDDENGFQSMPRPIPR